MIDFFEGEFRFLSNFWAEPGLADRLWGYPTVEHYFQAMKSLDTEERLVIKSLFNPGQAKRRGRHVQLRADWETIKFDVMRVGIEAKFTYFTNMAYRLLDTGDQELVEGNYWHDNVWGNCTCAKCVNIEGQNHLGKLLMGQRYVLLTGGETD